MVEGPNINLSLVLLGHLVILYADTLNLCLDEIVLRYMIDEVVHDDFEYRNVPGP